MIKNLVVFSCLFPLLLAGHANAQEQKEKKQEDETQTLMLANKTIQMEAPTSWEKVDPRFAMIEAEFNIPKVEDDEAEKDGRLTIMAAGGSVEANIQRWIGQFSQPDGGDAEDKAKVEEMEIDGMDAHLVDISGTFADRPRPVAPPTMRENYRMLGAIVETGTAQYFIKFYGGKPTVDANEEKFKKFLKSMSQIQ